jgi:hypothetical protein
MTDGIPRAPDREIQVEQGEIHVEGVDLIFERDDVWILEIQTREKYPDIYGYSGEWIHIGRSDRTPGPGARPDMPLTQVSVPRTVRGWTVLTEGTGRYTIRVAWYRLPSLLEQRETRVTLWSDRDLADPGPDTNISSTGGRDDRAQLE